MFNLVKQILKIIKKKLKAILKNIKFKLDLLRIINIKLIIIINII